MQEGAVVSRRDEGPSFPVATAECQQAVTGGPESGLLKNAHEDRDHLRLARQL